MLVLAGARIFGFAGATADTDGLADGARLVVAAPVDSTAEAGAGAAAAGAAAGAAAAAGGAAGAAAGAGDALLEAVPGWAGAAGLEGVP